MGNLIADESRGFLHIVAGEGLRSDDSARHRSDLGVFKRPEQQLQPMLIGRCIVIEVGDDIGSALGEAAVARAAETRLRLDDIARSEIPRSKFRFPVPGGVIDDKDVVCGRLEPSHCLQALPQEAGTIAGADDDCDGQVQVLESVR